MDQNKIILSKKSNEVLQALFFILESKNGSYSFEDFENEFKDIKGKLMGSLLSGVTRTDFNGKRIVISIPQFGSRRKLWKVNSKITEQELKEMKEIINDILVERL